MNYRDDVLLWVEKMNPQLLVAGGKREPLSTAKRITLQHDAQVLIIKGVDGADYEEALELGLKVLLVEENHGKIVSFLERPSFSPHKNLFVATTDTLQLFPILKKFVFQKIQEHGDLSDITAHIGGMEMSFSEYRDLGEHILPNILSNLLHINRYIDGRDLIGSLDGEEVIVFGSGISLEGAIQEVQRMRHRPYIFATGTSLIKLLDAGIIPDFFVAIDPFSVGETFCSIKNVSIPIFYQNRTSKDLLFSHSGPKIFMGSSRGWQIEDALMQEMGEDNFFFDAGYNAGNFGAHIALSLGAKKVLLAGMDAIARGGEECITTSSGEKTRGDLLYGMDFFKRLQENFTDRYIEHYTKGLSFEGSKISTEIEIKGKAGTFVLPKCNSYSAGLSKKVIDRYFDHTMLDSAHNFLKRLHHQGVKHQALAACLLAEFSLEPFYLNYMLPLWDVWQYLIPNSEDVIAKITFFYKLLKKFSQKTGYGQGEFFLFGKKEGELLLYDEEGILREKSYFFNGKQEGTFEKYKSNGERSVFQQMANGLRHGLYKVYDGQSVIRSGFFSEGKPHGRQLCFYAGNIIDDVTFEHGKKCGIHKKFSLDGYKRSEIIYHKDSEFFDTIYYDRQGQKEYTAIWKDGLFFEERYAGKKKITSRIGKIEGGVMVFEESK